MGVAMKWDKREIGNVNAELHQSLTATLISTHDSVCSEIRWRCTGHYSRWSGDFALKQITTISATNKLALLANAINLA
jgi:hypothetical protein